MGEEIRDSHFTPADFVAFELRLREETTLLQEMLAGGMFSTHGNMAGIELEAWIIDEHARPLPINERFLAELDHAMVVPELSAFNVELNVEPQRLTGRALSLLGGELVATWHACRDAARRLGADVVAIGILPTVHDGDLTLSHMSNAQRYRALNEQILAAHGGAPLVLDIQGRQHLQAEHNHVMVEAAATSLQLHLQVTPDEAASVYNATLLASAAVVAVSANSPYVFEHDLWDESRIPLFEQSIGAGSGGGGRVTFGDRFESGSLVHCFTENLARFPVLLPSLRHDAPANLSHLRLHNGTIWRWNRPLVGFDDDGTPHLRIEHRVIPAGPTIIDALANAAFFWGLVRALVDRGEADTPSITFEQARWNFYEAARYGLHSSTNWLDGRLRPLREVLIEDCLPLAVEGLGQLGIEPGHIDHFLGIIGERVASDQNGATWQRRWVARHGFDVRALTENYMHRQNTEIPVHEWDVHA
jgi:gamma-glutamyl:cysteine ligase YbdK (ATP-grasp superfamily)